MKHGAAKMESQRLTTITDSAVSVKLIYIETTQSSETTFVELPVMSESEKSEKQESKNLPVARIHTDDNLSIDIFSSISADQIQSLIGAVTNIK